MEESNSALSANSAASRRGSGGRVQEKTELSSPRELEFITLVMGQSEAMLEQDVTLPWSWKPSWRIGIVGVDTVRGRVSVSVLAT